MSALDDIGSALGRALPVKEGRERVVVIGISALRSIEAARMAEGNEAKFETLCGYDIRAAEHVDGWAIQDVDADGKWHDAEILPDGGAYHSPEQAT